MNETLEADSAIQAENAWSAAEIEARSSRAQELLQELSARVIVRQVRQQTIASQRQAEAEREVAGLIASDWYAFAACKDTDNPDAFYAPNTFERKPERDARLAFVQQFCAVCPVKAQCLEYAFSAGDERGVWGDKNELQRKWILRHQQRAAARAAQAASKAAETA
ncbi:MAG TPA: WhiB family transcriptional regulator [Candidatus Saccharimonadales bacterium]|nr:WhiB family transcriptional regulator [Candidatus Saccharimonadales bacterium]